MGFFARLVQMWRGLFGLEPDAEARNAEAIYQTAIRRRSAQHGGLKDAVSRLVYLRNRVEAELRHRESDLGLLEESLLRAAGADDDERALLLIRKQRAVQADLERLRGEHARLASQAEEAKRGLGEVSAAINTLKRERTEMLARKAHALARIEVASALERSSETFRATDQALENVRASIHRLEDRADLELSVEVEDDELDVSLAALRRESQTHQDRDTLAALKEKLGKTTLAQAPLPGRAQRVAEVMS